MGTQPFCREHYLNFWNNWFFAELGTNLSRLHWTYSELKHMHHVEQLKDFLMIYKWRQLNHFWRRYGRFPEETIWIFGMIDFLLNLAPTLSRLHWAYSELKHMHLVEQLKDFLMIYKWRQLSHFLRRYSRFTEETIWIFGMIDFLLNLAPTLSQLHWVYFELKHMHVLEQIMSFLMIYKWRQFSDLSRGHSRFAESTISIFGIIDYLLNLAPIYLGCIRRIPNWSTCII